MSANTSAFHTFLDNALSQSVNLSFPAICIQRLRALTDYADVTVVDGAGVAANASVSSSPESIWGITYATCSAHCSSAGIPFSYPVFASAMTNYILPWLALTAQLPYETGGRWSDIMALFMALGSPVLITYSLSLTIITRIWIGEEFDKAPSVKKCKHYKNITGHIRDVLQEAQHMPLRANNRDGGLASLIVLRANVDGWWERVRRDLVRSRRRFSPSAIAQLLLAVIAWLLTIIAAFSTSLGDTETALQIASGSLWTWLVPIVIGWILIGAPNSDESMAAAFREHFADHVPGTAQTRQTPATNAVVGYNPEQQLPSVTSDQQPLVADDFLAVPLSPAGRNHHRHTSHGSSDAESNGSLEPNDRQMPADEAIMPEPRRDLPRKVRDVQEAIQCTGGLISHDPDTEVRARDVLSCAVSGDESQQGATYNYARSLTYPLLVARMLDCCRSAVRKDNSLHGKSVVDSPNDNAVASPEVDCQAMLSANPQLIARHAGLRATDSLNPYPTWSEVPDKVIRNMLIAGAVALGVQWGTTMSAFILAYYTPVVGLGCRSGSYEVYASASTIAWLSLLVGQILSNMAMRRYQEDEFNDVRGVVGHGEDDEEELDAPQYRTRRPRTKSHALICQFAVLFRLAGKLLCVMNTAWLLFTSVAEITGGFDNCWCSANRPSSMADAWVVMFKNSQDLATEASPIWGGALALTILVITVGSVYFAVSFRRRRLT